ncbi:MAG: hypothetical protein LBF54_02240 [Holosporaceae bacterium]|nr:hypothetical protein [Holosporaceae bacterium]
MKRMIQILSVFSGVTMFGDVGAGLLSHLKNAASGVASSVKNIYDKNKNSQLIKSAEALAGTAATVAATVAQNKMNNMVIQPLITNVQNGAMTLRDKVTEQVNAIRAQESQVIAQENAIVAQENAIAQAGATQVAAGQSQAAVEQTQQIQQLEGQRQQLDQQRQQFAALEAVYNTSLQQINNLLAVLASANLQRISSEVPVITNQIVTTLANTPFHDIAVQLLTQSGNDLANEAAKEINNQNAALQQQYGQ